MQFSSSHRVLKQSLLFIVFLLSIKVIDADNTVYQTLYTDATFNKFINTGLSVGLVDGQHGTTPTGAGTYAIPIKVTSGTNGMEPELAITYNSQTGTGLLGMGWSLTGLSSITLDNKNLYYENEVEPLSVTSEQHFYSSIQNKYNPFLLDGTRLIAINGNYGASGTTYAKNAEDFSVVTSSGISGTCTKCPSSFTMNTKEGYVLHYGNTNDSRVMATNNIHPIMWRVNKMTDNNGNYLEYVYEFVNGESRVKEINYTGNSSAGLLPYNKISFHYSSRNDKNFTFYRTSNIEFANGGQTPSTVTTLNNNSLLDKIEVFSENNILVKTYQFGYAFDGLYSLLQEVKEIGYDNLVPKELNSTIFRYGTPTDIKVAENTTITNYNTNNISATKSDNFSGDFDGDGFTDIMTAYYDDKIQNGNDYGKEYLSFKIFRKIPNTNNFQEVYNQVLSTWVPGTFFITINIRHIKVGDFNGDGLSDILFDNYEAYLNNSQFEKKDMHIYYSLGLTGTNQISLFPIPYSSTNNLPYKYLNFGDNIEKNPIITGDFDGDGITDIINTLQKVPVIQSGGTFFYDRNCNCYKYTLNVTSGESKMFISFPSKNIFYQPIVNGFNSNYVTFADGFLNDDKKILAVADFDGDGKDDCLLDKGHILTIAKDANNQNILRTIAKNNQSGEDEYLYRYYVGDFNGDGKGDMLSQKHNPNITNNNTNPWYIGYSTGNFCIGNGGLPGAIVSPISFTLNSQILFDQTPSSKNTRILTGDFNGDGKADIITQDYGIPVPLTSNAITIKTYFSNGNSFVHGGRIDILNNDSYLPDVLGDFNGDGAIDILCKSSNTHATNGKPYIVISVGNQQKERFLKKIIDGFNRRVEFTYKPLTADANHYAKGTTILNHPINYIQIPSYTVSTLATSDGAGGLKTRTFKYFGLKFQKTGLGLLGFDKVTETNSQNNFVSESVYETKSVGTTTYYPNTLKTFRIFDGSNNTDLFKAEYTNEFVELGNRRYFNYVSSIVENNYLTGRNNIHQFSYNTTNGNLLSVSSNTNSSTEISTTNFNNYSTYASSPYPNLPSDIAYTNQRTGSFQFEKNTHIDYLANGNPSVIYDFYNTPKQITTTNSYNNLGNISSTTVSGSFSDGTGTITESITENMTYTSNGRMLNTYTVPNLLSTITNNSSNYDKKWGLPTSTSDAIARHTVQNTYDAFGKLIKLTPSVATGSTSYDITTAYDWSTLYNSTFKITTTITGQAPTITYYDAFGRMVREEKTLNGKLTFVENSYNAKGELVTQKTNNANSGTITTTNTYDAYQRLSTSSINATGVSTSLGYAVNGANFIVTNTTTNQPVVKTTYDGTGKKIKVEETGDGTTISNDYTYHSNGQLLSVVQGGKTLILNEYDIVGNQTKMTDIDAGVNLYEYDAFGQVRKQTDAKGNVIEQVYDNNARTVGKIVTDISMPSNNTIETYTYNALNVDGPGELKTIMRIGISDPSLNLLENYEYDNFDRLKKTIRNFENKDFVTEFGYGNYDRVNKVIYPTVNVNPMTLNYTLTNDGFVTNVSAINGSGASKSIFNTQAGNYNTFGQIKIYSLGNGKFSTRTINDLGLPTNYKTELLPLVHIQNLSMTWDLSTGNLLQRKEESNRQYKPNFTENFTYDKFQRLKTMQINALPVQTINYDAKGNITNKFDAGTEYKYKTDKIHAVEYIKAGMGYPSPQPDDRTDISTTTQDIIYNAFNQPALITEGNKELKYVYDFDGQRIKSIYKENGNVVNTRYYMGNYEFETNGGVITNPASITRQLNYIYAPCGLASVLYKETGSADAYVFTYTDHLGSIVHVTLDNGLVIHDQNFDAWGRQRNPINWNYTGLPVQPPAIYRGFTGHEMLPQFSLVNMNGRMYDPIVGRMLSPDNNVGDAFNTQTYNRYSYVWNNPLKYIDPSGEDGKPIPVLTNYDSYLRSNFFGGSANYMGSASTGSASTSSVSSFYNGGITQSYSEGNSSNGDAFSYQGNSESGMSINGMMNLLNFASMLPNLIKGLVQSIKGVNTTNSVATTNIINNVSNESKGVSSGDGCMVKYMSTATACDKPYCTGHIYKQQRYFNDKIQDIPILGSMLDNIYVPVTRFTRVIGKPLFGDWYGETHINGESANSDDAVIGLGMSALTFLTGGAASGAAKNGSFFNYTSKTFRFAFETGYRAPLKGTASSSIKAWHFNINKSHFYINPFKWKYYYKWADPKKWKWVNPLNWKWVNPFKSKPKSKMK